MFILRRILKDGVQINTSLGEDYVLVRRVENKDEFERAVKLWSESDTEDVYALITYDEGQKIMPLYNGGNYYIMSENGSTFDNVTQR